jgi:hypothetical protein
MFTTPAFTSSSIFNIDFIKKQRQISLEKGTVIFDLYGTIAYPKSSAGFFEFVIRPGILESIQKLKDRNVHLVLWSTCDRDACAHFFREHPSFCYFFDLVLVQENFFYNTDYTSSDRENLLSILKELNIEDPSKKIINLYEASSLGMLAKNVSLVFGSSAIIIEDSEKIFETSKLSPTGEFNILFVESFNPYDTVKQQRIIDLERKVLESIKLSSSSHSGSK